MLLLELFHAKNGLHYAMESQGRNRQQGDTVRESVRIAQYLYKKTPIHGRKVRGTREVLTLGRMGEKCRDATVCGRFTRPKPPPPRLRPAESALDRIKYFRWCRQLSKLVAVRHSDRSDKTNVFAG